MKPYTWHKTTLIAVAATAALALSTVAQARDTNWETTGERVRTFKGTQYYVIKQRRTNPFGSEETRVTAHPFMPDGTPDFTKTAAVRTNKTSFTGHARTNNSVDEYEIEQESSFVVNDPLSDASEVLVKKTHRQMGTTYKRTTDPKFQYPDMSPGEYARTEFTRNPDRVFVTHHEVRHFREGLHTSVFSTQTWNRQAQDPAYVMNTIVAEKGHDALTITEQAIAGYFDTTQPIPELNYGTLFVGGGVFPPGPGNYAGKTKRIHFSPRSTRAYREELEHWPLPDDAKDRPHFDAQLAHQVPALLTGMISYDGPVSKSHVWQTLKSASLKYLGIRPTLFHRYF